MSYFENVLESEYNIDPQQYLRLVNINSLLSNYGEVFFSENPKYKLKLFNRKTGKYIHFGSSDYKDFIIYQLTRPFNFALQRRNLYLARAKNILGNWKNDKLSKNNLAINILWQ